MTNDRELSVAERLAALEQASDERRAELRGVLDQLPHAVSRRALVVAAAQDVRSAPGKSQIAIRAVKKIGRIPGALVRRVGAR